MLKLEFIDQRQTSFWIVDEVFSIGSSNKNQMVIARENILSTHASVYAQDGIISIEPSSADAQISVNYVPIGSLTVIRIGDVISLAGTELRLIDPTVRQRRSLPDPIVVPENHSKPAESQSTPEPSNTSGKRVQPWKIKAITGAQKDKLIDVSGTLSVGRDSSNDLVVSGGHISRRHAELYVSNDQLLVRDLDSSNGTSVNGDRIKERAVFLGDEISFDSVVFRVAVGKAPTSLHESSMDKTQFRPALQIDDELLDDTSPDLELGIDETVDFVVGAGNLTSDDLPIQASIQSNTVLLKQQDIINPDSKNKIQLKTNASFIALAIVCVLGLVAAGFAFL